MKNAGLQALTTNIILVYYAILSVVSDLNVKVTVHPITPAPAKPTEMRKGVDQSYCLEPSHL